MAQLLLTVLVVMFTVQLAHAETPAPSLGSGLHDWEIFAKQEMTRDRDFVSLMTERAQEDEMDLKTASKLKNSLKDVDQEISELSTFVKQVESGKLQREAVFEREDLRSRVFALQETVSHLESIAQMLDESEEGGIVNRPVAALDHD